MIGFREDGFQPFRNKLRALSDRELIQFGWELRKKCFKPKEDRCWKELELACDEWPFEAQGKRVARKRGKQKTDAESRSGAGIPYGKLRDGDSHN